MRITRRKKILAIKRVLKRLNKELLIEASRSHVVDWQLKLQHDINWYEEYLAEMMVNEPSENYYWR